MNQEEKYIPPFSINNEITNLVIEIAELTGRISARIGITPSPQLRKHSLIRTIQSSLAIENNTLTIEQVTDIINGKRVLGAPNEIQEVKNAIDVYKLLLTLNPFNESDLLRAHKIMMSNLVNENGRYRSGGVGVFDGNKCIHMARAATRVPTLMKDLFSWVKETNIHPLISSCVFHYEFEFIHPFADGNGRMGRLWQTLLLMQWNSIFAWLPVETIVKEHQQQYYDAIAQSDNIGNSTPFILFMLQCIKRALEELRESDQKSSQKSDQKILTAIKNNPDITINEISEEIKMSVSGVKKVLKQLREKGIIERVGSRKGGHWEINQKRL